MKEYFRVSKWEQRSDIVMDVHQFNVCLCSSAWYILPIRQHSVLSGLEPESCYLLVVVPESLDSAEWMSVCQFDPWTRVLWQNASSRGEERNRRMPAGKNTNLLGEYSVPVSIVENGVVVHELGK